MAIIYPTVTLGGHDYPALAAIDDAELYLAADPGADAWRAGDEDDRRRWLIGASRALLARSFVPGVLDGAAVPVPLARAAIVLAAAMAAGFVPGSPPSQQIKRQKAGSVEQDFYYAEAVATLFPRAVMDLLTGLLASVGTVTGAIVNGVCGRSSFVDQFRVGFEGASSDDDNRWFRTYE